MNWTDDYVTVMESLRLNSVYMSRNHKQKYFAYKRMSQLFPRAHYCLICSGECLIGRVTSVREPTTYQWNHLSCHDDYRDT
jgi:hypothetical protein